MRPISVKIRSENLIHSATVLAVGTACQLQKIANCQISTTQLASAQRAGERRRRAQHGGVRSIGWLGVFTLATLIEPATCPTRRGRTPGCEDFPQQACRFASLFRSRAPMNCLEPKAVPILFQLHCIWRLRYGAFQLFRLCSEMIAGQKVSLPQYSLNRSRFARSDQASFVGTRIPMFRQWL